MTHFTESQRAELTAATSAKTPVRDLATDGEEHPVSGDMLALQRAPLARIIATVPVLLEGLDAA